MEETMPSATEQLKNTPWWKPAIKKFAAQMIAKKNLDCADLRTTFEQFASEILSTPVHRRDELLKVGYTAEELELARLEAAPGVKYPQYVQPIPSEQTFGTSGRPKK